ncbi:MAG: ribosome maturation factor RimM [Bacilli bacterium]|nr:ribosome maturation factor RimM [Bacilli bacterium]
MAEYLLLGFVQDTFSLDGTLKIISKTDFAEKRYQKGNEIFLYSPKTKDRITLTVVSFRKSGQFDFVKVEEINNVDEALQYKGYEIHAIKDYQNMAKDTYYFDDIVGCKVLDDMQTILGEVSLVEEFPAQLTLRVKRGNNQPDFFVPFVKAFIKEVDITKKIIVINVIGGLL